MSLNIVYFESKDDDTLKEIKEWLLSYMRDEKYWNFLKEEDFEIFDNINVKSFETPLMPKELFFMLITFGINDNSIIYYRGWSKYWLSNNRHFFPVLKITDNYIVLSQDLNFKKIERLKSNMNFQISHIKDYNILREAVFTASHLPWVIPFETTFIPPLTGLTLLNKSKLKIQYYFHYNPYLKWNVPEIAAYLSVNTDATIDETDIEFFNQLYSDYLNELIKFMFSDTDNLTSDTNDDNELDKWIESMNETWIYNSYKNYLDMYMESYMVKRKELEELGLSEEKIKQIEKKWFKN